MGCRGKKKPEKLTKCTPLPGVKIQGRTKESMEPVKVRKKMEKTARDQELRKYNGIPAENTQ